MMLRSMFKRVENKRPAWWPGQFLKEGLARSRYLTLCGLKLF